jgi:hypothetical protein
MLKAAFLSIVEAIYFEIVRLRCLILIYGQLPRRGRIRTTLKNAVNGWNLRQSAKTLYRVRTARKILVVQYDNGFFANFLQVLDALAHAPRGCKVFVDWTLTGNEKHFRYGAPGTNIWDAIFEPLSSREEFDAAPGDAFVFKTRLNPLLASFGRALLCRRNRAFRSVRRRYNKIYERHIKIRNPYVLSEVAACSPRMREHGCIGIHKRLGVPDVAVFQQMYRMPSNDDALQAVQRVLSRIGDRHPLVFLATDDLECAALFRASFGSRLLCRDGVQRVRAAGGVEVHTQEWGSLGVKDACDVLIDGLLLSQCDTTLQLASNVTLSAAIINPNTKFEYYGAI